MPLPATHLYYSNRIFKNVFCNESEFLIGSIIPDIRYISGMKRDETHFDISSEIELANSIFSLKKNDKNFFYKTGALTHSFLDQWWRNQVYIESNNPYIKIIVQLVEEEIVFYKLDRINVAIKLRKALNGGVKGYLKKDCHLFFGEIIKYLEKERWDMQPLIKIFASEKKLSNKDIDNLKTGVDNFRNNEKLLRQLKKAKKICRGIIQT